jgi:hypothetical protein
VQIIVSEAAVKSGLAASSTSALEIIGEIALGAAASTA